MSDREPEVHGYRYSASQIATFRDCKRKWAFYIIDRVKGETNSFALLGSYIHKVLEKYLTDGSLPEGQGLAISVTKKDGEVKEYTHDDIMAIILPGLKYLPKPGEAVIEGKFALDLGELGTLIGFIDYFVDGEIPLVGDHKTTSSLDWAMTKKELAEDVQATVYAVYAMEKTGAVQVSLQWGYFQTGKPKARKVPITLSLTQVDKLWYSILENIKEMKRLRDSGVRAADVEYDATACKKYGGCPYQNNLCRLTGAEKLRSYSAMSTLRDRMKARKGELEITPAPETEKPEAAPAAETPEPAINPPEGMSAIERLKARKAQQAAKAEPAAEPVAAPAAKAKPAPAAKAKPAPAAKAKPAPSTQEDTGFELYLDCVPNKPYVDFTELVEPVLGALQAEHGCHYRLIDGLYGGNAALFAQTLDDFLGEHLTANPGTIVVASTKSQAVCDGLDALMYHADLVVRGL